MPWPTERLTAGSGHCGRIEVTDQDRIDEAFESSAILEWQATILYGPAEADWGAPEQEFEDLLTKLEIDISGMDAGTELSTGKRDFTWYFNATVDQVRTIRDRTEGWTIEEIN